MMKTFNKFGHNFILIRSYTNNDFEHDEHYVEEVYRIEGTLFEVVITDDMKHGYSLNIYDTLREEEILAVEEVPIEEVRGALKAFISLSIE